MQQCCICNLMTHIHTINHDRKVKYNWALFVNISPLDSLRYPVSLKVYKSMNQYS